MNRPASGVDEAVERICVLGCAQVTAFITALKRGESRSEYAALSEAQRAALLRELEAIMAVYK